MYIIPEKDVEQEKKHQNGMVKTFPAFLFWVAILINVYIEKDVESCGILDEFTSFTYLRIWNPCFAETLMKAAEHPGGSEHRLSLEATIELFLKKSQCTSLSEIRYIIWLVVFKFFF